MAMILSREGKDDIRVADVLRVARSAGNAIMNVYSEDPEKWDSRLKSDDTPVTKADLMADGLIREGLLKAYPDVPIISEESEQLPFEERKGFEYYWVVDPLDGTKEFMNRTGDFAVMIGLCFRDSPVLGVVYAPAQDVPRMYYAVSGKGAFVLEGAEDVTDIEHSRRISARAFSMSQPGLRLAVSTSRPPEAFIAACNLPEVATNCLPVEPLLASSCRRFVESTFQMTVGHTHKLGIGSAGLKAIAVAMGKADIYPCFYSTSEWDTCATQVIVEEAGGSVVRFEGEETRGLMGAGALQQPVTDSNGQERNIESKFKLGYNKENLANPSCLFLGKFRD